jgi:hypothetical protein
MSDTAVAIVGDKDLDFAFGSVGFGEFGTQMSFPYLSIIAKTSDMAVEGSQTYVEGAKPGMFINSKTKRLYGKTIQVVILEYCTRYKEFTRKTNGQNDQFVRIVPLEEIATYSANQLKEYTKNFLPNGNNLVEVKDMYVYLPQFKEDGVLLFEHSKGSFRHVRYWGTEVVKTGLPYPACIWEVSTGLISKAEYPYFTIGTDDVTLVKKLGKITELIPDFVHEVKDHFDFVQAIRAQEKTGGMKLATPVHETVEDDSIPY